MGLGARHDRQWTAASDVDQRRGLRGFSVADGERREAFGVFEHQPLHAGVGFDLGRLRSGGGAGVELAGG